MSLSLKTLCKCLRIEKIVLNTGVKEAVADSQKLLRKSKRLLIRFLDNHRSKRKHIKSIAGFKLREGVQIGVMVTLRGKRMYAFLDRLINLALPAVRDFQGVTTTFDGRGNYNLRYKRQRLDGLS